MKTIFLVNYIIMNESDELLEVINEQGEVIRLATRSECHSNPALIHRVVHVIVRDSKNRVYLQKRSQHKDIQPGKWDTSVGGHLCPAEQLEHGAARELEEELGISGTKLSYMYQYMMTSDRETELVSTFLLSWDGPVFPNVHEIEEGRFWTVAEIEASLGTGRLTPNFEDEFKRFQAWQRQQSLSGH